MADACRELRADNVDGIAELPERELVRRVEAGLRRARKYMLDGELLYLFLKLQFQIAPNFDEHPAFHEILTATEFPSELRLELLRNCIVAEDIRAARAAASSAVWYEDERGEA